MMCNLCFQTHAKAITFAFVLRLLTILIFAFCSACSGIGYREQEHFDLAQLQGRWEFNNGLTKQIEEWSLTSKNELRGRGYVIGMGDTTFIEYLTIRKQDSTLTFFAQTTEEAGNEVVPFRVKRQTEDEIEFENTLLEFPKRIVYKMLSDTSFLSFIEGPRDGENVRVDFHFVKARQ